MRYGTEITSKFTEWVAVNGSISCNNAEFGDPSVGDTKHCYCLSDNCAQEGHDGYGRPEGCCDGLFLVAEIRPKSNPGYPTWKHIHMCRDIHAELCADEGGNCDCTGKVRFGAGNHLTEWKVTNGTTHCTTEMFGDPLEGEEKHCYCAKCGQRDDDTHFFPNGCCKGFIEIAVPRLTSEDDYCDSDHKGYGISCWKDKKICRDCAPEGHDRYGSGAYAGCCEGLFAVNEPRPQSEDHYCTPSNPLHNKSCWSSRTICRARRNLDAKPIGFEDKDAANRPSYEQEAFAGKKHGENYLYV